MGLNPTTPQSAAGMRTEPPPSTPRATGHSPAQTAAADPLEEPPATLPALYGFLVDLHARRTGALGTFGDMNQLAIQTHHHSIIIRSVHEPAGHSNAMDRPRRRVIT